MNTRFDSLWEIFEIEQRILAKDNFEVLDKSYSPKNKIKTPEKFEEFVLLTQDSMKL